MTSVPLAVAIRHEDVLRFLGYPERHRPRPRVEGLVRALSVEAGSLVAARGVYRRLPVEAASDVGLEPMEAAGLVIGLVTIGDAIERRASDLADAGNVTAAVILDAIGSVAVEEAANRLSACAVSDRRRHPGPPTPSAERDKAPAISCRISPGYGRWPLTAQPKLFEQLPHAAIAVALLPSLLMVPRKSISFAMWMGADARPIAGLSGCAHCELDPCLYRRAPPDCERP